MLKILNFLKSAKGETKLLTMRQRFEAAEVEMNAVLAELSEMPVVRIDAAQRQLELVAPDQFADEALALPAPDPKDPEIENIVENDAAELAKAS